jgi:Na+/H+ antiporter NhaD/arsenite permease-like protein
VLPFVAMLLAIALLPLALPHWWESNRNKLLVSAGLGLPVLLLYLARAPRVLAHTAGDYASFIVLLTGLYVIAGGILLRGDLEATPLVNSAFLAAGAALASLIGTTGASMLIIRALLQTNQERERVIHTVVFFIFLVSNIGGMLTPLGDPPLFLGYLAGVPFAWTLRLWRPWLTMILVLLVVYFVWDTIQHRRESRAALRRDHTRIEPLRIDGGLNGLWLVGVVATVAVLHAPLRELAILGLADGGSGGALPRHLPDHDPHARAAPRARWRAGGPRAMEVVGVPHAILVAISVGAVAMGANTYIGNAPNLMVKAIAESRGVRMPSFFGFMLWSGVILIPLFIIATFIFFR